MCVQDVSVSGLAGMVALAPLSVGSASVWRAEQGNYLIWQRAAEAAGTLKLNERVSAVTQDASTRFVSVRCYHRIAVAFVSLCT